MKPINSKERFNALKRFILACLVPILALLLILFSRDMSLKLERQMPQKQEENSAGLGLLVRTTSLLNNLLQADAQFMSSGVTTPAYKIRDWERELSEAETALKTFSENDSLIAGLIPFIGFVREQRDIGNNFRDTIASIKEKNHGLKQQLDEKEELDCTELEEKIDRLKKDVDEWKVRYFECMLKKQKVSGGTGNNSMEIESLTKYNLQLIKDKEKLEKLTEKLEYKMYAADKTFTNLQRVLDSQKNSGVFKNAKKDCESKLKEISEIFKQKKP